MRACAAGLIILVVLALANVVGAGVYLALWPIAAEISGDETYMMIATCAVGILAVVCAVLFLVGATSHLPRLLQSTRNALK